MQQMIRTTITFPEDIYQQLKIMAVMEKKTLSDVVTNLARQTKTDINQKKKLKKNKDILNVLGGFHIGISHTYNNRDELYENHTKHKMGIR